MDIMGYEMTATNSTACLRSKLRRLERRRKERDMNAEAAKANKPLPFPKKPKQYAAARITPITVYVYADQGQGWKSRAARGLFKPTTVMVSTYVNSRAFELHYRHSSTPFSM